MTFDFSKNFRAADKNFHRIAAKNDAEKTAADNPMAMSRNDGSPIATIRTKKLPNEIAPARDRGSVFMAMGSK